MRLQCAGLGIPPEQLFAGQDPDEADNEPHELWPEHWGAWQVFLGVSSQWQLQLGFGAAHWMAPPYPSVEQVMARYRIPEDERDEVFQFYQVLEREAVMLKNKSMTTD